MRKRIFVAILTAVVLTGLSRATAQNTSASTSRDPYRNFLGDWSGVFVINPANMPPVVAVHITEDAQTGQMRWDYVFGVPSEKGYKKDTKWFLLNPAKNRMQTYWQIAGNKQKFKTVGLDVFSERGFGHFSAEAGNVRVTFELQPTLLAYMWEVDDGKGYKIGSKIVLKRNDSHPDVDPNDVAPTEIKRK